MIKYLAVIMGICYLVAPMQHHVIHLLHDFSHAIEGAHQATFKGKAWGSLSSGHENHDHEMGEMNHHHHILDIVKLVFSDSDENDDSEESILFEFKIDKHIKTNELIKTLFLIVPHRADFDMLKLKLTSGFLKKSFRPPQLYS